jgi:hypothetical protein
MTLDELGGKLRELETTRKLAHAELARLLEHKERLTELEQDRDVLLESYVEMVPDALDDLRARRGAVSTGCSDSRVRLSQKRAWR